MQILTSEEINETAQKYDKSCYCSHTSGEEPAYHFISGADHVNSHYKKVLEEINDKIYGKDKMSFICVHLLRSFTSEQLISIRDFLIERTPKSNG